MVVYPTYPTCPPTGAWPTFSMEGLSPSQIRLMEAVSSGSNVYCSGMGGTGKTYMINSIRKLAAAGGLKVAVCAPTGMASFLIEGLTIHRTFRAETGIIPPYEAKVISFLKDKDIIIVDEISMCRLDLFEYVIRCIQKTQEECFMDNYRAAGRPPFRSTQIKKQILLFGDFGQLAPVLYSHDKSNYLKHFPDGKVFAFNSPLWEHMGFSEIDLLEVIRQKDQAYIDKLRRVRMGDCEVLRFFRQRQPGSPTAVTLCTRNETADSINNRYLDRLNGIWNYPIYIQGSVSNDEIVAEQTLRLAPGARVIFLTNDKASRWNNGSTGTVLECREDRIIVRKDDGTDVDVERFTWPVREPAKKRVLTSFGGTPTFVEEDDMKVIGEYSQFPLRLGWAITVHKSQGQTLDEVNIADDRFFVEGQLYVALSRCRSEQGLHILGQLHKSDLLVNEDFLSFDANIRLYLPRRA